MSAQLKSMIKNIVEGKETEAALDFHSFATDRLKTSVTEAQLDEGAKKMTDEEKSFVSKFLAIDPKVTPTEVKVFFGIMGGGQGFSMENLHNMFKRTGFVQNGSWSKNKKWLTKYGVTEAEWDHVNKTTGATPAQKKELEELEDQMQALRDEALELRAHRKDEKPVWEKRSAVFDKILALKKQIKKSQK